MYLSVSSLCWLSLTSVCAALGSSMRADVADEGDEPLAWRPVGLAAGRLQPELESPGLLLVLLVLALLQLSAHAPNTAV